MTSATKPIMPSGPGTPISVRDGEPPLLGRRTRRSPAEVARMRRTPLDLTALDLDSQRLNGEIARLSRLIRIAEDGRREVEQPWLAAYEAQLAQLRGRVEAARAERAGVTPLRHALAALRRYPWVTLPDPDLAEEVGELLDEAPSARVVRQRYREAATALGVASRRGIADRFGALTRARQQIAPLAVLSGLERGKAIAGTETAPAEVRERLHARLIVALGGAPRE